MTPAAPSLDPRICRFANEAMAEMNVDQALSILGLSRWTVTRLCEHGKISAVELSGARTTGADHARKRWTISSAALLRYIIASTSGDRTLLLQAIREQCPQWLHHAEAWATEPPEAEGMTNDEARMTNDGAAELPANVIPMKRKRAAHADPYAGMPDLFPAQQAG